MSEQLKYEPKTLPFGTFMEVYKYTEGALRALIFKHWTEGVEYHKAPNGRIHIDLEGYEQWVRGNSLPASELSAANLKSESQPSTGKPAKVSGSQKGSKRRRLTRPSGRSNIHSLV